jgi:hypothetical protein
LGKLRPQKRARTGDGGQLGIESLPVSARETGDSPFDFSHPGAATPAGRQVGMDLSCAALCEFAIRRL